MLCRRRASSRTGKRWARLYVGMMTLRSMPVRMDFNHLHASIVSWNRARLDLVVLIKLKKQENLTEIKVASSPSLSAGVSMKDFSEKLEEEILGQWGRQKALPDRIYFFKVLRRNLGLIGLGVL